MRDLTTVPMSRLFELRQFPFLGRADLDELVMFAENATEVRYPAGSVVSDGGHGPPALHLVLDGKIEGGAATYAARQVYGLLEILANRPAPFPARTVVETRALVLEAPDCIELLEDNFSVLRALLAALAGRLIAHPLPAPPRSSAVVVPPGPLTMVERLIVLRRQSSLSDARLQPLAALAQLSQEVRWPAGATVIRRGERADGSIVLLEGTLAPTCCSTVPTLGPGESIGALRTLASLRHEHEYVATTPVRALQSGEAALFDVLEDHTDLALAVVGRLAAALLDGEVALDDLGPELSGAWSTAGASCAGAGGVS